MFCECHQIGGRFIAEDPDCPVHGREGQAEDARVELIELELAAWRERFPQYRYRPQDDMVGLI